MSDLATFTIGKKGRVVIPARIRKATGLEEGTVVTATVDREGRVIMETPASIKARIRRKASVAQDMGSAVDELIADRKTDRSLDR